MSKRIRGNIAAECRNTVDLGYIISNLLGVLHFEAVGAMCRCQFFEDCFPCLIHFHKHSFL